MTEKADSKPHGKFKTVPSSRVLRLKKYYKIRGNGAVRLNLEAATKSCSFKKSVRSVFDADLVAKAE